MAHSWEFVNGNPPPRFYTGLSTLASVQCCVVASAWSVATAKRALRNARIERPATPHAEQDGAMPKKLLFVLTFACAGVLTACGAHNEYTTVTVTPTPYPTATAATLEATYKATPLPGVTINMYASTVNFNSVSPTATSTPEALPTGPVLQSQVTGSDGTAVFNSLVPGTSYCWTLNYTNGTATLSARTCTNNWGYGTTMYIGT